MPKLDIDMFDDTPKVGDKVKVLGKVLSIDEDTGDVEVSYDEAKIIKKRKKSRRDNDNDDDDDDVEFERTVVMENEMMPQSQSLDSALAQAFPRTQ